jgi:hypothetical protein
MAQQDCTVKLSVFGVITLIALIFGLIPGYVDRDTFLMFVFETAEILWK